MIDELLRRASARDDATSRGSTPRVTDIAAAGGGLGAGLGNGEMLIPAARVGRVIGCRGAVIQVFAEIFAEICAFAMNQSRSHYVYHQGLRLETGAHNDFITISLCIIM